MSDPVTPAAPDLPRDAFVGGVGIHEFGRFDKPFEAMGKEAVQEALEDAGLTIHDVEHGLCSNAYLPVSTGVQVLAQLGRTGIPVSDVDAASASAVVGVEYGRYLVSTGVADVVLAFGVEKSPSGFLDPTNIYPEWMCRMGLSQNPQYWAMNARRHMHEHGTTEEQIARVAVKNHRNSTDNPNAHYTQAMDVDEVLESRLVCDPIRLYELCAPNEGAAAAVICSRDAIEAHGVEDPVRIEACVHTTSQFPVNQVASYCTTPTDNESVHRQTADLAYEAAGVSPDDLDLAEVQDTDAFCEIEAYEELRFCDRGEGGAFVESGRADPDGELPVNVSGGLISKGEPIGASHLGQLHELALQLRGEAGSRQVPGAETGLAHVYGAHGQCGITVLRAP
jgi:acetyl-CoA acetyltransferase